MSSNQQLGGVLRCCLINQVDDFSMSVRPDCIEHLQIAIKAFSYLQQKLFANNAVKIIHYENTIMQMKVNRKEVHLDKGRGKTSR